MDVSSASEKLYEELSADFPDHLPIHTSFLQSIVSSDPKKQLPLLTAKEIQAQNKSEIEKIIGVCNKALENINQESLLAYYALKSDQRLDATKIKSAMERQKTVLLESLCHKGVAMCRLYQLSQVSVDDEPSTEHHRVTVEEIAEVWRNLLKFIDPYDKASTANVLYFAMWHASVHKHYGRLLKLLLKLQEDKNLREIEEKCIEVCGIVGWDHVVYYLTSALPSKYPSEYRNF